MKTPTSGKQVLTIKMLNEFLQSTKCTVSYPCSNWDKLLVLVNDIRRTEVGVKFLINQNKGARRQCYEIMFADGLPVFQRVKQMMDIAKVDMIIEALQWTLGSKIEPELKGWDYQFGYGWHRKARVLVLNEDWDNPFWYNSYAEFHKPCKTEGKQVVVEKDKHNLPLITKSVKQVILNPQSDVLLIEIDGNIKAIKWEDLDDFWNSRDNEIGINAQLLMDLTDDRKNILRSDGKLHKSFGKKGEPAKQISSLCKALDGLVMAEDEQDRTRPKRWFKKSKHRVPTYKPRFRVNSSIKKPIYDFIDDLQSGKPITQSVVKWDYDNNDISKKDNQVTVKGQKLANQYYDDLSVSPVQIDRLMDIEMTIKDSDDILD